MAADEADTESKLLLTFVDLKSQGKWKSCCRAAVDCCQQMLGSVQPKDDEYKSILDNEDEEKYIYPSQSTVRPSSNAKCCPPTWDGWTCWQRTISNRVALAQCPSYIYFETEPPACSRKSSKMIRLKNCIAILSMISPNIPIER